MLKEINILQSEFLRRQKSRKELIKFLAATLDANPPAVKGPLVGYGTFLIYLEVQQGKRLRNAKKEWNEGHWKVFQVLWSENVGL